MSAGQLLRYAVQRIPEQPAVPKEIIFIDKLPLPAVGKPIKHLLQADAARRVFNAAPRRGDPCRVFRAVHDRRLSRRVAF